MRSLAVSEERPCCEELHLDRAWCVSRVCQRVFIVSCSVNEIIFQVFPDGVWD